ncbi:MAG: hypothetical protein ACIAS6_10720 [Phycisphaerales bacterium JB060]
MDAQRFKFCPTSFGLGSLLVLVIGTSLLVGSPSPSGHGKLPTLSDGEQATTDNSGPWLNYERTQITSNEKTAKHQYVSPFSYDRVGVELQQVDTSNQELPQTGRADRVATTRNDSIRDKYRVVIPRGRVAENGSWHGQPNANGVPKTVYVRGYYRRDGTYVRGHYRSAPGTNP